MLWRCWPLPDQRGQGHCGAGDALYHWGLPKQLVDARSRAVARLLSLPEEEEIRHLCLSQSLRHRPWLTFLQMVKQAADFLWSRQRLWQKQCRSWC